jgi:hypothetical protein
MIYKKINLTLLSILSIVLIYSVPFYNNWFHEKIFTENNDMMDQMDHLSYEERMLFRFGASYNVYKAVVKMVTSSSGPPPIILIPTNNYVRAMKVGGDFLMAEPAVFYYFTGIKGVLATSPDADKANWVLLVEGQQMAIRTIKDKNDFNALVATYKKYPM